MVLSLRREDTFAAPQTPALTKSIHHKSDFEVLFRSHYKALVGYANRLVANVEVSEDLVQQVFVNLWERRDQIEIEGSHRSYLLRSVHNACLNHFKHEQVKKDHATHALITESNSESHDLLEEEELRERVFKHINELPEQCRKIFTMNRLDGLKYQQIADELNLSVKTVENQMGKALKHMREKLLTKSTIENLRLISILFWLIVGVKPMSIVISTN